ncbi:MAG TPA: hypothetical protein VN516_07635 [Candidatus Baltobacteraceae bacterium]|nr:hypothetical protein [Candidatus Baltobacteraceae bacterium]
MAQLQKINLEAIVPPIARTVQLKYRFESKFGGALLFRSPSDRQPIELKPPNGQIEVDLVEPQAIYIQELDGTCGFNIMAAGFSF